MIYFTFILLGVYWVSQSINLWPLPNLGSFQPFLIWIFCWYLSLSPSYWVSNDKNVTRIATVTQIPEFLFILSKAFLSLLFRLWFLYIDLSSSALILSYVISTLLLSSFDHFKIYITVFFSSKISIFKDSISLTNLLYFYSFEDYFNDAWWW